MVSATGEDEITRYEDRKTGAARSFCRRCGTPLIYQRAGKKMINIPRALFLSRTGRQPVHPAAALEFADFDQRGEEVRKRRA